MDASILLIQRGQQYENKSRLHRYISIIMWNSLKANIKTIITRFNNVVPVTLQLTLNRFTSCYSNVFIVDSPVLHWYTPWKHHFQGVKQCNTGLKWVNKSNRRGKIFNKQLCRSLLYNNGATVSAAVTLKIISSNYNFYLGSLDGDALAIAFKWLPENHLKGCLCLKA